MKKIIVTLVILLLSFNCLLAQFSGGSGTSGDPWQISNTADLDTLSAYSTYWGDYFIQTTNINAPAGSFSPIGDSTTNFTGTYDGDEHTIDGLYINNISINYCGLFGYTNGSNIINLGVINVDISANIYAGGLVGRNSSGTVSNCYSTGIVSGTGRVVGGLVGLNISGGEITECYSTCSVTTGIRASGGLVGRNSSSTVSNCYSRGDVNGGVRVGGLIGFNRGSGTVSNCYSTSSVMGNSPVGGLVGENTATVNNSFWDTETSGQSISDGGTGLPTDSMNTLETFTEVGWDFVGISIDSIWNIGNGRNDGYPYFQWQYPVDPPLPVELSSFTASVSINDVTLKWTTAWEINNTGFEVERQSLSSGKDIWTKIGFVQGNGTTNQPKNYTFEDKKLYTGKYNYRLIQIDYNNAATIYDLSSTIDIGVPKKHELSQNYPNPFNPITKIDYNITYNSKVTLKVFDITGREISTLVNETKEAGYYTVQFNASEYASGTYFYRITAQNGQDNFVMTKRMILIK